MNYDTNEVIKQVPPVTVSTLSLFNVQLSEWVYVLTIVYLILQIVILARKVLRK